MGVLKKTQIKTKNANQNTNKQNKTPKEESWFFKEKFAR